MSGFQIWIPREHLGYYQQYYSGSSQEDVLNIKDRIEHLLNNNQVEGDHKEATSNQVLAENTSHSTTEGNLLHEEMSNEDDGNDADGSIMDRADVLFKYILRSFRKHYCKSF
jgi:hypothetical protein